VAAGPNLFLIGAMKAGTSALHRALAQHPDLYMSEPKEPRFFTRPELWPGGAAAYEALFRAGRDCRFRGESSTEYAKAPLFAGTAERIAGYAPDARILYLVRDPIARAVSHYWFNWQVHGERRDPRVAFREDPHYLLFGDYAMQLARYRRCFPAQQIRVVVLEEIERDPRRELAGVWSWLGLDPAAAVRAEFEARNATPAALPSRRPAWLAALRATPLWRGLRPALPRALRRALRERVEAPVARAASVRDAAREALGPACRERVRALAEQLSRGFPLWEGGAEPHSEAGAVARIEVVA